ncbi:MAG: phosphate ABC transporter ATP-binding protein [Acidobacteria bacterium]|nr:MAG: phosphate ABC transporter ATP-binding protein [Acidobacteriota bacterium]
MRAEHAELSTTVDAGNSPDPATIRTEDLRARAGSVEILKGITLEARRGEILSIIGPAGAGKTTFLRCLNRMVDLDPDLRVSGKASLDGVSIYGREIDLASLRRRVGMVFSVPVPLPMTIFDNLAFGLRLADRSPDLRAERIEAALRAAYLWDEVKDRMNEPARNLSGGQQQRLCLARALVLAPEALLLDEPSSGLDPISTAKIEEALQQLKTDLAIVLVTNNVKQAARASDRTSFFLFGEQIEVDVTERLFTNPRDARTADYISGRFG